MKQKGCRIAPTSPYMRSLVHAVIGNHFELSDTGGDMDDGKTLSPTVVRLNGCVGNHLTGLLFIDNLPHKVGGFDKDGNNTFGLYCKMTGLKSYQNWASVEKPKINNNDWKSVELASLFLFDIMQSLTSDLWHKISKKKGRRPGWQSKRVFGTQQD